jgi:hypothetical protein
MKPSVNGPNGRDSRGRFAVGNAGGPGNPHVKQTALLRAKLLDAVTPDDVEAVVKQLVAMARAGDIPAIRELLDRIFGKPSSSDLADRVERLEELIEGRYEHTPPEAG